MISEKLPTSLCEIFADTFEIPIEEMTPESSPDTIKTWDSFRHLQLVLSIENEYAVQFDPQEIPQLTSFGKVQTALEQKGVHL